MAQSASAAERQRREAHQQRAYEIQFAGGVEGAIKWTIGGALACVVGHYTWPVFARQTLGLKAFITSSATMCGLVIGADDHLLRFEHGMRAEENELRRQARNALALEGKIASETEIRKWRERREKQMALDKEKEAAVVGMSSVQETPIAPAAAGSGATGKVVEELKGSAVPPPAQPAPLTSLSSEGEKA
ncbi:hypothetical protein I350_04386 [Cryptococcus amylolentus CBS 6273]|uniref:HIG1 domain-containing protein n=1 Tax=Cryptococcus amylolentus CBS 6273 TaxID=1296118 RepID=A0A1E3K1V2_9TREE|nr:hypothetical protein I350_04386 [Cryptococcus amylolentus CBS 6273]